MAEEGSQKQFDSKKRRLEEEKSGDFGKLRKPLVSEEEENNQGMLIADSDFAAGDSEVTKIQSVDLMFDGHLCLPGYKTCNPDWNHWMVTTRTPKERELSSAGGLPGFYLRLLSRALTIPTAVAKQRIYIIAGLDCPGFAVQGDEEMAFQLERSHDVIFISRDCLWDRRFHEDKCRWDSKQIWGKACDTYAKEYDPSDSEAEDAELPDSNYAEL